MRIAMIIVNTMYCMPCKKAKTAARCYLVFYKTYYNPSMRELQNVYGRTMDKNYTHDHYKKFAIMITVYYATLR